MRTLTMRISSLEQLRQFIAINHIDRIDGILVFKGIVHFTRDSNDHTINSHIQIIILPVNAALYILEFLKEGYNQNEMYSTSDYQFRCMDDKTLQISNDNSSVKITLSLSSDQ